VVEYSVVRLRVHFASLGFQVQRIVEPMKMLHADVGIILTYSWTDRAQHLLPKVVDNLKESGIKSVIVKCNIWDTSEVVNEIGAVVTATPQHEYYFNVSTGTRNAAIAGAIAGMFWHVRPYFMAINDQDKPLHSEQDFPVNGMPNFVPTFEVPVLEKQALNALEFLASRSTSSLKREVLSYLKERGVIGPRLKESVSDQALQGQVDSILNKLSSWGFIELSGRGKKLKIGITREGIEGRKMFFHMLNPKRPLDVLL
jgi:hypothetical protein